MQKILVEIAQKDKIYSLIDPCKKLDKVQIDKKLIKKCLKGVIEHFPNFKQVKIIELSIIFCDQEHMRSLNLEFMNKDYATNVLSFPDIEINFRKILEFQPDDNYIYIGDIAFCNPVIEEEANRNKISFIDHFLHLLVHSILHLFGFDHELDQDAEVMEALEALILKDLSDALYKKRE